MPGQKLFDRLIERGLLPVMPVIFLTGHGDVPLAVEAMRKGAVTFIEKPFADEALESALALAFETRPGAAPSPAAGSPEDDAFAARLARLTAREREVIDWVIKGKLNKVIADLLGISIKTVELHRKNAMTKLQARSVIELTRLMVTGKVS